MTVGGEVDPRARATRVEGSELAAWSSPLLAEAAHADGAPSMRAVEGNQTALIGYNDKVRAVEGRPSRRSKREGVGRGQTAARPVPARIWGEVAG